MPPKPTATAENHEVRIQRLEESVTELKVETAQVSTNLGNLTKVVNDGFEAVKEKIEDLVSPLTTALKTHEAEDDKAHDELEAVKGRVEVLEQHVQGRQSLVKGIRTFFVAALTGATAIGLKELVVWLVHR